MPLYPTTSTTRKFDDALSIEAIPTEFWTSISGTERREIVVRLSNSLHEMSELAQARKMPDLQTMLKHLSASFQEASAEIASASYGPVLIERLFSSVSRISQNLAASNAN